MAEITYSSTVHPTEQLVLDFASENLQPNSVYLPLVLNAGMPVGTQNKDFRKKGTLTREVLAENAASTYQAYSETKTQLTAVKSVVSVRTSVESLEFSAVPLPSIIGEEAGKAFAKGMDEDIADLFFSSSDTQAHSGSGFLKYIDISSAALKVRTAINGQSERIVFAGHLKQVQEVLGRDLLTGSGTLLGNSNSGIAKGADAYNVGAGLVGEYGGIWFYQSAICDTQTVSTVNSYIGAVFAPSRAIVGMYGNFGVLEADDTANIRKSKAYYVFSDFGLHWDQALISVSSPVA